MKKLLLATAALVALSLPVSAATVGNLGINPHSSQGNFNNAPTTGPFEDQILFQLVGGPQFITIASVTNTYAAPSDFITGFTAAVWTTGANSIINDFDDVAVVGPIGAAACPFVPLCQGMAGTALLNAGDYYIEISGSAGSTAGYAGTLSVAETPIPGAVWLFASGAAGLGALLRRRKKKLATA